MDGEVLGRARTGGAGRADWHDGLVSSPYRAAVPVCPGREVAGRPTSALIPKGRKSALWSKSTLRPRERPRPMVSRKTLMQNRQPSCPGRRLFGRRNRRALPGELRGYPATCTGAAVARALADIDGHAGARAVPQSARALRPEICHSWRLHGLCQPCDALLAGRHGARAHVAEAFGRAHAPDARRRGARTWRVHPNNWWRSTRR